MNLRHITPKRNLSNIYEDGVLRPASNLGIRQQSSDSGHVAFELDPQSDALYRMFPYLKAHLRLQEGDFFILDFDGDRLIADGYHPIELSQYKIQIQHLVGQHGFTMDDYDSVGLFRFIQGEVPLRYLAEESRERLENFLSLQSRK